MSKQTSTWLEPLLTRELRRVAAPPVGEPLWAEPAPRRSSSMWFACASAAGLLLASAVGLHTYISNATPLAAALSLALPTSSSSHDFTSGQPHVPTLSFKPAAIAA